MTAQQHSTHSSCEIIIVLIYDPPLRKGKNENVYHFIKIYVIRPLGLNNILNKNMLFLPRWAHFEIFLMSFSSKLVCIISSKFIFVCYILIHTFLFIFYFYYFSELILVDKSKNETEGQGASQDSACMPGTDHAIPNEASTEEHNDY